MSIENGSTYQSNMFNTISNHHLEILDLPKNIEIYLNELNKFKTKFEQYGYFENEKRSLPRELEVQNISIEFINFKLGLKILCSFTVWTKSQCTLISFNMFKIPRNNSFFSLFDFLKNQNLENKITDELSEGGDVQSFVENYFRDLGHLLDNELNPQISGKIFDNHASALCMSLEEQEVE